MTLHRDRRHTSTMPRKEAIEQPQPSPVADFERSLDSLEQLVERMEKGDLSLDESLAAYEEGVGLYRRCQTALEEAEMRVRLLTDPQDPSTAQPYPDASAPDA
ncbi:exodeoxyribonuclease VII small subunit [Lysobacter sp. HA35]